MNESIKSKPSILPRKRSNPANPIISQAEKTILARKGKAIDSEETKGAEKIAEEIPQSPDQKKANSDLAKLAKELDKIFTPDNFRGVVRAPADLMLAASGRKIWDIPEKEIDTLATTGALTARNFVKTDPKWISLILFSMALLTTYGGRAGMHYQEVKKETAANRRREPAQVSSGNELKSGLLP